MHQVIIALGIVLALIGVGAIAAGAPSWALGLGLGSSLIQSGSIGLVGGFLLVGIGFVLRALEDLSRRIDQVSGVSAPAPAPARPAAPLPASRPRREPPPSRREPPLVTREEYEEPAEEVDEGAVAPRPRARAWPPATDARPLDARTGERSRPPAPEPPAAGRGEFPDPRRSRFAPERRPEPAPEMRSQRGGGADGSTVVVRSGIIHGMAYTLYADGSIEAELPIGTVRFASIEELQDHVSRTGDEADVDFAGKPTS
jgi:hypothetical protein